MIMGHVCVKSLYAWETNPFCILLKIAGWRLFSFLCFGGGTIFIKNTVKKMERQVWNFALFEATHKGS